MNQLATPSWTLKEVGRKFENSTKFVPNINRQYDPTKVAGAKIGDSVNYRLPPRFTVSDGQALELQNLLDQTVPIALTNQKHVDMSWSAWQETTQVEEVQDRYIDPAGRALASVIDAFAFRGVFKSIYNAVGTIGTVPATQQVYVDAVTKLLDGAIDGGFVAVLDTMAMGRLSMTTSTLFNPSSTISQNYKTGQMGRNQFGIDDWYYDQNRPSFTTGAVAAASTPLVNGASQTGSSIVTDGWGAGTALKTGDVVTLGGVNAVNALSYESTSRLQQFVLITDAADDGAGNLTMSVKPSIVLSGALQSVDASPANNAVITYWNMAAGGTWATQQSPQSMVFHKDFAAFVTADLAMPNGGARATRINSKMRGLAFRMAEQWDVHTDQNITRIDSLVGVAPLQERLACRVVG